jgi:hypothetical protein
MQNGFVSGVLPLALVRSRLTGNRAVCLPFSQYAGPLVNDSGVLDCFLNHLKEYLNEVEFVHIRTREPLDPSSVVKSGFIDLGHCLRYSISLESRDIPTIWKSLSKHSVRSAITKSHKCGIEIDTWNHKEDIGVLQSLMFATCRKHRIPPYPPKLIEEIVHDLVPRKLATILKAQLQGEVVAVLVLFTMNNEGLYAYGFSNPEFLGFRPNNALLWAGIEYCAEKGFTRIDLGTSSPQDGDLMSFKKHWGSTVDRLNEYFAGTKIRRDFVTDKRESYRYKLAMFAWRFFVPEFLARQVGPMILRHFG